MLTSISVSSNVSLQTYGNKLYIHLLPSKPCSLTTSSDPTSFHQIKNVPLCLIFCILLMFH